jgi:hypothetical protein
MTADATPTDEMKAQADAMVERRMHSAGETREQAVKHIVDWLRDHAEAIEEERAVEASADPPSAVRRHKEVHVRVDDFEADVDEGMVELVTACWRAEIFTSECCEEIADSGMARLSFLSLDDMERFYDAVRDDGDRSGDEIFDAWPWQLWADGGLRGYVHIPRDRLSWAASRVAALPPETDVAPDDAAHVPLPSRASLERGGVPRPAP